MSDNSSSGVPVRRVVERQLDLLLAEELSCRPSFARWFLDQCSFHTSLPAGDPAETDVRLNDFDLGDGELDVSGENDLFIEATWPTGQVARVLIEDKIDAPLQPRQVERYGLRIESHRSQVDHAAGAIVAPAGYLDARGTELDPLARISIESIADRLTAEADAESGELKRRLRWRAEQLVQLKAARRTMTKSHEPTVAISDWMTSKIVEAVPDAVPGGMRTINTTWIYFRRPDALIYKVSHGLVDIYLKYAWPGDPERQAHVFNGPQFPLGFAPDTDSQGNEVLRRVVHGPLVVGDLWRDGSPIHQAELLVGIDACVEALRWLRKHDAQW